jgi:hypothetical protein
MRHIQFSPDELIIDIRKDRVFKAAFTADSPASRGALRALVSAYIGRNVETLTVIANEPSPANTWDRHIRYDVRVRCGGGELVNVEVSLRPGGFEPLRCEYYLARLHTGQDVQDAAGGYGALRPSWQMSLPGAELRGGSLWRRDFHGLKK